ncbi:hypothetical protein CDAR_262381, partial [Caerostris darwini]
MLPNISCKSLTTTCGFENSCPGEFACGHLPCSSLYASQHFLQSLTITCGFENSCPGEFACGHLPCSSL